jgi:hypothetical protein
MTQDRRIRTVDPVAHRAARLHEREVTDMPVFMVDRDLPGVTMDALAQAQRLAIDTAESKRRQGKEVRYIRSTFVPGEAHCMCLFEAPTAEDVAELNDEAGLPYTRVTEALDLTP